ncbi:UDP-4-amino-4,6-dideoxy-N-acetyl-beta-L-altrosamine transaminase [Paenibacillus thermoaerophilus]|uniref:UDP-4-amino-4, 6-dideoxy-N-acetyl-beta-L-altrosamine transaminase n=1 Tax=Paenibacillus thermoaerophilus TaxID=1215385 RepID=A0ABW2V8M6_9BACL|nr:UDP-4-amino-4,6-dideoxy-N-acetyl-beta-L-altrosamine transaminase [Paenibacillus thermoaerophilus]TMV09219.1 UDP-4-amino-4,6-dideoxy-N-acetyl-beta-L-altrosamine transaminase [Paenibacillus thermoaerophilus]
MTLALHGGRPVRDTMLPYGQQWIDDQDVEAVLRVLRGPYLTQGPAVPAFERKVAEFVGARHAVAFTNGTAALHAACYAAGLGPGDEVITTPITFVASANCALYVGAKPFFADIDPHTYNLDPAQVEAAITPRTKAIVAVDFTGQPADMDAINAIADRHGLVVIQDAAHSIGATYKGRKVGTLAAMTMFSFHPVKHVTTGEGGVIVTDSDEYAAKLRLFRSHGITREHMERDEGPWYYEMVDLGYNYRMTDLQAGLGASQMDKLPMFLERRRRWAEMYTRELLQWDEIITPCQLPDTNSAWHLYMIQFKGDRLNGTRRDWFDAMRAENIGVHVHYIPVYRQPYYRKLGYEPGLCPVAEKWYSQAMTLPLYAKMEERDVHDVIEALGKVVRYFAKSR